MIVTEQALVNHIINYLVLKGHYVWRQNTGAMKTDQGRFIRFGFKGVSDVLGIEKGTGKFIAIECKIKGNKPTQFQTDFLEAIRKRGGYAILAYSLEDVTAIL